MAKLTDRLRNGWNAFRNKDPAYDKKFLDFAPQTYISSTRPDRMHFSRGIDRTIVSAIYNRIAIDVSSCDYRHVKIDENGRYLEEINSDLNRCLKLESNLDQTSRAFIQDVVQSLCDEGCIAIVPTDTDTDPTETDSYRIYEMRTGKILEWHPSFVRVEVYNERTGKREEINCFKKDVCIIENPLYSIMNDRNSTLQRLIHKLNLLDRNDEDQCSGKLDLIIQLPYVVKTESKRQQAETRRKEIETQLTGSKYGIAYTDGTEHITQLNRSVENQLFDQIKYLTSMLYGQLGLTEEIMNGTANEEAMTNYMARTIEPFASAIVDEMKRKFLTQTARTQGQTIMFFKDPFKLISTTNIAQIADAFTRNAIMSSNEVRAIIGMKPSNQAGADDLRNKNLNQSADEKNTQENQNENELEDNLNMLKEQMPT